MTLGFGLSPFCSSYSSTSGVIIVKIFAENLNTDVLPWLLQPLNNKSVFRNLIHLFITHQFTAQLLMGIDGSVHHFLSSVVISSVCQTLDVLASSPSYGPQLECGFVEGEVLEHFHGSIVLVFSCCFSLLPSGCAELTFFLLLLPPSHTCSSSKPMYSSTCTALKEQLIHPLWDTCISFCCVSASQCLLFCPAWGLQSLLIFSLVSLSQVVLQPTISSLAPARSIFNPCLVSVCAL